MLMKISCNDALLKYYSREFFLPPSSAPAFRLSKLHLKNAVIESRRKMLNYDYTKLPAQWFNIQQE
jgi:hypothetical protein